MNKKDKEFKTFLSQLLPTNANLNYFTNFAKIIANINKISIKLNQLNYLIGKENLKEAINELYQENPKCFEVLNILIAVRNNPKILNNNEIILLKDCFNNPELIFNYFQETGLEKIFKNKNINNLIDYVFGIEVGLDTNARKNRSGQNMSRMVSDIFDKENISYKKEIKINLGSDIKYFDFVIKTRNKTYLIEVNFYNVGGSKLNEITRSYSELFFKISKNKDFEFIWITDGQGWLSAKNKLEEAFKIIPNIYNLTTIKKFISKVKN